MDRAFIVVVIHAVRAAHGLHHKGPRGGRVEGFELVVTEPAGHEEGAEGYEEQDDHGKPDGRDGLGDGESGPESHQLDGHEDPHRALSVEPRQRFGRFVRQLAILQQVEKFGDDSVGREGLGTHNEEEPGENGLGNEVKHDKERTGHGAEKQQALRQVTDTLLDHVVNYPYDLHFACRILVIWALPDLAGSTQCIRVEGCLRDESVRKWDTKETRDPGGQSEKEYVPVETRWFTEWEFSSLRHQRRDYNASC